MPPELFDVPADLLTALRAITDPRCRRGVRHPLVAVLGLRCARCSPAPAPTWRSPSESAFRRVLQAIDPHLLDRTICSWLPSRAGTAEPSNWPGRRWRAIAIDGKTARGARVGDGRAVHLLAALEHADGVVLGQRVVDGKTNEITEFAPLLDGIDITGTIVTADALHTQRQHAEYLIGHGAHYLLVDREGVLNDAVRDDLAWV